MRTAKVTELTLHPSAATVPEMLAALPHARRQDNERTVRGQSGPAPPRTEVTLWFTVCMPCVPWVAG
jgi:hypothetical protein